jgi:hypothetical protein
MTKKIVRFAEDYKSGDVFDLGSYDVTREEIVEFSERYDPFPFHVDDELKLSKKMALPPPTPRVYDTINTRTMTKLCVFQQWQNSQKLVFLNLLKILFFPLQPSFPLCLCDLQVHPGLGLCFSFHYPCSDVVDCAEALHCPTGAEVFGQVVPEVLIVSQVPRFPVSSVQSPCGQFLGLFHGSTR